ncbi:hypothetical protein OS493_026791 [Desmophyllum pertusum]|uniref:3'-5' exonuclease domain-containing protein n=1 Tax=Desmophyllum pertusum TaxID=174260 RepID=A0A9X0D1W5_9CNID|nr:hypothetical protein OS493_026791 [Desmophyllum pertusum]
MGKTNECNPLNLRAMCAIFLHQRLSKGDGYDWSKEDLTDKQLIYASTDAWASLRIYEEMKRTAEVLGISLSPPLKSTMDVFKLRRKVKTANNRNSAIRKKRNRKSKKH